MAMMSKPATSGFSSASSYDAHRPSYPAKAFSELLSALKLKGLEGARVVEIGAGTGKFTELLARQEEKYDVVAVEPHEAMREELTRKALERVQIRDGAAERTGVERETADAVICAQVRSEPRNCESSPQTCGRLRPDN